MARLTRRAFLQSSVGTATGIAAAGAVGLATGGVIGAVVGDTSEVADAANEPMVAHVRTGSRGDVTLMVGHREVTVRDPVLVNRMRRAAR
jgi:hypothetical protein